MFDNDVVRCLGSGLLITRAKPRFDIETDREKKKVIQWVYRHIASWEFRFTMSGLIDILHDCFKAKNRLEKRQTPQRVQEIRETPQANMDYHRDRVTEVAQKVRCRVQAGQDVGGLPDAEPASELERCLAHYLTTASEKLHIRYEKSNSKVVERWLTIVGFRDASHVDATFGHLDHFAGECIDKLMQRFPSLEATLAHWLFDIGWEHTPAAFRAACRNLATHMQVDPVLFLGEAQQLWDHRAVVLANSPELVDLPMELWLRA